MAIFQIQTDLVQMKPRGHDADAAGVWARGSTCRVAPTPGGITAHSCGAQGRAAP